MNSLNTGPLVLSADDDEDAQFLLRRAFIKAGVNAALIEAHDGREAIEYLDGEGRFSDREKFPLPTLLLLDLKMPVLSGFDVLEFIRKQPRLQTFPVLVFSSSENIDDVKRASELGCHSYLVKPSDFENLVELVRTVGRDFLEGASGRQETARDYPVASLARFGPRFNAQEAQRKTGNEPAQSPPPQRGILAACPAVAYATPAQPPRPNGAF